MDDYIKPRDFHMLRTYTNPIIHLITHLITIDQLIPAPAIDHLLNQLSNTKDQLAS